MLCNMLYTLLNKEQILNKFFCRLRSGNPGYLVAYQTGDESAIVDLSGIPRVSDEINVVAYSPNYSRDTEIVR